MAADPTPIPDFAAYLADAGLACPGCRKGSPRRLHGMARSCVDGPVRTLKVACYCAWCDLDWFEVYRLAGAEPASSVDDEIPS